MNELKVEPGSLTFCKSEIALDSLVVFKTGGSARVERTDRSVAGQAARGSQRSAGSTGETARGPGTNGEFTEGQPGASGSGKGSHRLWTGTGRSAHSGNYAKDG